MLELAEKIDKHQLGLSKFHFRLAFGRPFRNLPPRRGRKENYAETAKHDKPFHA
jgi:hypothetical protein